jgi:hypothetical protein
MSDSLSELNTLRENRTYPDFGSLEKAPQGFPSSEKRHLSEWNTQWDNTLNTQKISKISWNPPDQNEYKIR